MLFSSSDSGSHSLGCCSATDTADPLVRELFDSVDDDGGGALDRDELVQVLRMVYARLARSEKQARACQPADLCV